MKNHSYRHNCKYKPIGWISAHCSLVQHRHLPPLKTALFCSTVHLTILVYLSLGIRQITSWKCLFLPIKHKGNMDDEQGYIHSHYTCLTFPKINCSPKRHGVDFTQVCDALEIKWSNTDTLKKAITEIFLITT